MTYARSFPHGAISTPHYLSSLAGAHVLAAGGNAVDAIVAANLALGVVAPYYCGAGGDLLALVYDGSVHGYRSTGRAPSGSSVETVSARTGAAEMPIAGPHTITVPGAVRGWFDLLERWGSASFADLARRAVELARDGFMLTVPGAYRLNGSIAISRHLGVDVTDLAATYRGVEPLGLLRQPALADTLELLGRDGPSAYYGGPIGDAIAATIQRHGGFMTAADIAAHEPAWVTPMQAEFAGRRVVQLPPPSQGVTALEMMRIADAAGLPDIGPDRTHLLIEIAKLALADRDQYVGDPAHMPLPAERLIDDEWIAARTAELDRARARPLAPRRTPDGGTAYLCCADRDGLLVSLIQSNFTSIGSGVHVPEYGINLHNRGASFCFAPGHVNALAPGKLPMHTLMPGLVLDGAGVPSHVYGTMGGHAQAQIHLQLLVAMLVDEDDPQVAIDEPRWQVDPATGLVQIESRVPQEWRDDLVARGHDIRVLRAFDDGVGHAHCIERRESGYLAAGDPRAESAALGV